MAMSLTTPLSVQKVQTALHDKAKGSPNFRFYVLYDKVYREDVLACAVWRSNRLRGLCFRIRHPSEVSACSIRRVLHRHGTGGTWALPRRVPSFRGSR